MRIGDETITVPKYGGVVVGPAMLRQVFNDTDSEVLWLVVGAPENEWSSIGKPDVSLFYPIDPMQLPKELEGSIWPPTE